jgi:uncharacterized protein DUF6915
MGDVLAHSRSSAKKFGGVTEDYVPIHKFLDQSKLFIADWRHRALLHTTFGIALCEQMFGDLYVRPSDGVQVSSRTVASQHIIEDLGCVPTPEVFLREMPVRPWMNGLNHAQIKEMQNKQAVESKPIHPWGNGGAVCDLCGKDCDGHDGEGFQ